MRILIAGTFLLLHGLVHLLYFGQSRRLFELSPGMVWPDGSWAFSKLLGEETTRSLASICLVLVAIGFAAGAIGVFLQQDWWRPVVVGSAAFSSVLYVLMWDGKLQMLSEKGGVGILIDVVILVAAVVLRWPL